MLQGKARMLAKVRVTANLLTILVLVMSLRPGLALANDLGGSDVNPAKSPIKPGETLTLKHALRLAFKYHPRRMEREAEAAAAHERIGEAESAMLPHVKALGEYLGYSTNLIRHIFFMPTPGYNLLGWQHCDTCEPFNRFNYENTMLGALYGQQYLYDFGRVRGFIEQRRYEAAAAIARQQETDLNLIFEVANAYYKLLRGEQEVRIYEEAVKQRELHLHQADVKTKARLRPALDVYVTTAQRARAQLHLVKARNMAADAKVELDNAMGLSGIAPDYKVAKSFKYQPVTDEFNELLQTAYRYRPDVKMLKDLAAAMGARIVEYTSDYFPRVFGMANTSSLTGGFGNMVNNYYIGTMAMWDAFSGYLTTHQVAETRKMREALDDELEELNQRIYLEVTVALLDWRAAYERVERARKALAASRVELELADKRYQAGLGDIVELEDAQRHYTRDDAQYAEALYEYAVARAATDHATGRSLMSAPATN